MVVALAWFCMLKRSRFDCSGGLVQVAVWSSRDFVDDLSLPALSHRRAPVPAVSGRLHCFYSRISIGFLFMIEKGIHGLVFIVYIYIPILYLDFVGPLGAFRTCIPLTYASLG